MFNIDLLPVGKPIDPMARRVGVADVGFGRLCSKKKHEQCSYFLEIVPKLCYFLKIMLSVPEIMLLRFYTDFKENKDHQ